ncbi:MAG TPA: HAMP domain-containing sensor histidine kinase [Verrucomicrobiae bacterium]|nr:HAMP domain-containing sensor histidine kinase [Verrucomicrobiae bacterium]
MPSKRDGERAVSALADSRIVCCACGNLSELCEGIREGAGAALLTEEALLSDSHCLAEVLRQEPSWSNFPVVVLTQPSSRATSWPHQDRINVTLVERPLSFETLRSVLKSALRHRHHQYEVRDTLSELSRAQADLKQANSELENRVQERTRELRETITELEAFSYTVSHDLRTPLRSIHGYANALLEDHAGALNDEGKYFLSKISAGAARLDVMVQDVLTYSRIAKGEIQLQEVNIAEVIRDVLESYPHLNTAGTISVEGPFPPVRAHPGYLTQCVSNLLGNAIKFVPPGRDAKIRIWAEIEPGGENVRLWFEDNGIGISSQHFGRIFEIFGRINPSGTYEGTGIGLAIVRKAAERMGGNVGVTSEPGKGSQFWLSLKKAS